MVDEIPAEFGIGAVGFDAEWTAAASVESGVDLIQLAALSNRPGEVDVLFIRPRRISVHESVKRLLSGAEPGGVVYGAGVEQDLARLRALGIEGRLVDVSGGGLGLERAACVILGADPWKQEVEPEMVEWGEPLGRVEEIMYAALDAFWTLVLGLCQSTIDPPRITFGEMSEYRSYFGSMIGLEQGTATAADTIPVVQVESAGRQLEIVVDRSRLRDAQRQLGEARAAFDVRGADNWVMVTGREPAATGERHVVELGEGRPAVGKALRVGHGAIFARMGDMLRRLPEEMASLPPPLRGILGQGIVPTAMDVPPDPEFDGLDPSQCAAVRNAEQHPMFFIQGPPGTGKTHTLARLVARAVRRGETVLVASSSNAACDNALAKIAQVVDPTNIVRLVSAGGWPGNEDTGPFSARERILAGLEADDELLALYTRKIEKGFLPKEAFSQMRALELAHLREQVRRCSVVVTTLATAGAGIADPDSRRHHLFLSPRNLVVIDEAAHATEPETLLAAQLASDRVVLVGDNRQEGPIVRNEAAQRKGLDRPLVDRLEKTPHGMPSNTLLRSYRLVEPLLRFPRETYYKGKDLESAQDRIPPRLQFRGISVGRTPCNTVWIDSRGSEKVVHRSIENQKEAERVEEAVQSCLEQGIAPGSITILTFYRSQVDRLRVMFRDRGIEVATVDEFQGQENDVIVLSTVRSRQGPGPHQIGFLNDPRRHNVAITRARFYNLVVGNASFLAHASPLWYYYIDAVGMDAIVRNGGGEDEEDQETEPFALPLPAPPRPNLDDPRSFYIERLDTNPSARAKKSVSKPKNQEQEQDQQRPASVPPPEMAVDLHLSVLSGAVRSVMSGYESMQLTEVGARLRALVGARYRRFQPLVRHLRSLAPWYAVDSRSSPELLHNVGAHIQRLAGRYGYENVGAIGSQLQSILGAEAYNNLRPLRRTMDLVRYEDDNLFNTAIAHTLAIIGLRDGVATGELGSRLREVLGAAIFERIRPINARTIERWQSFLDVPIFRCEQRGRGLFVYRI